MNSFGEVIKISLVGESHNDSMSLLIDSLPSGIKIDVSKINDSLKNKYVDETLISSRIENDEVIIENGMFNGFTTGLPLLIKLKNSNVDSSSYIKGEIRPSHVDLVNYYKYGEYFDYRGSNMFSGRITSLFIALGSLIKQVKDYLKLDYEVSSTLTSIHDLSLKGFDFNNLDDDINNLKNKKLKVLNDEDIERLKEEIKKTRQEKDSIGVTIQTIIKSPIGLGEPYFDSLESEISHLLFSLGGVKGIIFGNGENVPFLKGSQANDMTEYNNGQIRYLSNNDGGINGGITNGNIVYFKTFIKPTPSIGKIQKSINYETKENIDLLIKGRHDPCFGIKLPIIIDSMLEYLMLEMILRRDRYEVRINR